MRKVLFLLIVLDSFLSFALSTTSVESSSESYRPMLEEGRTWWYTSRFRGMPELFAETGVSVGREVEIDGELWKEIVVTAYIELDNGVLTTTDNTRRVIAYMREADGSVFTKYTYECYDNIKCVPSLGNYSGDWLGGREGVQTTYAFAGKDETYTMGGDWRSKEVTVLDVSTINNSGIDYRLYNTTEIDYVEGIGAVKRPFYDPLSGGVTALGVFGFNELRYVTEADGSVIYEGIGGFKQWDSDGVAEVSANSPIVERWYNLQGLEVSAPTSPGVYIRRSGTESRKILIQ